MSIQACFLGTTRHARPASGAPFAIHGVHRPQQRDLSTNLLDLEWGGDGASPPFEASPMSIHPDPAESSSTIYVHQTPPLPEGPTMIRDRFWTRRVEEVRARRGMGRAGCRNSRWVFVLRSESMAQAEKTAVCAVPAPLDVTHRATRPRGGHWGGIPRACL